MYFRIIESNLLMAEAYLLCDDPEACRLELAEVERILGGIVCFPNKENMKRQGKKVSNNYIKKSTREIILQDNDNAENYLLGASPSLPRQLLDIPIWLSHSWHECRVNKLSHCVACKSNPLKLSMVVYKFFAYHGAAMDMTEGIY